MEQWKEYKLGDISNMKYGKLPPKQNNGSYPIWSGYRNVGFATTYNCRKGTIIVVARGVGGTGDVKISSEDCFLTNLSIAVELDNKICEPLYFYYKYKLSNLRYLDTGSAQSQITIDDLKRLSLKLPPLEEQKRITEILSSIDYKIELNRRINDNLEQQAQALFKSWFVNNPNPNWREATLSEVAHFIGGYSYNGEELTDSSNVAMATIKNFGRNGGFKVDGFKDITPLGKLKECHYANMFDILVAHTDLTQNADVIGNAELLLTKGNYESIIFSMDLVKVLPNNSFPYKFLLAAMLKSKVFKGHCLGYVNGTTVLHLSKKALPEFEIKIPSESEANMMNDTLASLYKRMAEVLQENDRLTRLRDTLLPKLISGELKINDLNC